MRTARTALVCAGVVMSLAPLAVADWFPGEPHKMHFPQLPDPFGWDVNGTTPMILADDWQCSETGPVSDIHIWGSWAEGITGTITDMRLSIHDNIPEDPTDPTSFSQPGSLLWAQNFTSSQLQIIDPYGTGDQGWFDPATGVSISSDHNTYHQINIENILNPFVQTFGEIYWLDVSVTVEVGPVPTQWGWKTSQDHFMDNAVWSAFGSPWKELYDPLAVPPQPLDLAFVITPEPSSLGLLLLGGLALVGRRKRRSA